MLDIKSLSYQELIDYITSLGEPKYRGKQIFSWLHEKCVADFADMSNLSRKLRESLQKKAYITEYEIVKISVSKDGTGKFLFRLSDDNLIESVLMKYEHGLSVCISTQVGCGMGCTFCASGMNGFVRNLTVSEILEEVYSVIRHTGKRINNIVFMGMGEPLLNYDNLVKAIRIFSHETGQNLSPRHITISTCGIIPGIMALAQEDLPITLALSLHFPTQKQRQEIMPISKTYHLNEVISACKYYRNKTGRRITYEYCYQKGNDRDIDVEKLAELLAGQDAHINLIPLHRVEGLLTRQGRNIVDFKKKLEKKGLNVTIRRELGQDIDGACGQLRMKYL